MHSIDASISACSRAKQSANTSMQPITLPLSEPAPSTSQPEPEVEQVFLDADSDDEDDPESAEAVADALSHFHDADVEELDESVADVSGDTLLFEDIFGLRDPLCMSTFSPTEEEPIAPVHVDDLEEVDGSMGDEDIDQYLNL